MKNALPVLMLTSSLVGACSLPGSSDQDASPDLTERADAAINMPADAIVDVASAREGGSQSDSGDVASAAPVAVVDVRVTTGRATSGRVMVISVRFFTTEPPSSIPPTIATQGNCVAFDTSVGPTDALAEDLGAGVVTASIGGGAPQALDRNPSDNSYQLSIPTAPPAGTHVQIATLASSRLPAIVENIASSDIQYQTPVPVGSGLDATLRYTIGSDLTVTWPATANTMGVVTMTAAAASGAVRTSLSCAATPSVGTITIPWALLHQYAPANPPLTVIDGSMALLVQAQTGSDVQAGVSVNWTATSEDDARFSAVP